MERVGHGLDPVSGTGLTARLLQNLRYFDRELALRNVLVRKILFVNVFYKLDIIFSYMFCTVTGDEEVQV